MPATDVNDSATCVAIGECMLELSGMPGDYQLGFGGDTLNAAVYMSRQGAKIDYLTALGDDQYSEKMLSQWHAEGVGTSLIRRLPGRLPGLYIIETDSEGERQFHYWRNNSPARELFEGVAGSELFEKLLHYDYIYLSGISLSLWSVSAREALLDFLALYKQSGGKVIFDSNYRPRGWPSSEAARELFDTLLPLVDTALPSLEDEQLLHPSMSAEDVLEHYRSFGVTEIVVKNGPAGCLAWSSEEGLFRQTFTPVDAIDTTAAGDSFNGSYLAARMRGESIRASIDIAHEVASRVVQHAGAIIPAG